MSPALYSRLSQVQKAALAVGLLALAATGYGALSNRSQFFFSYLFGWLFWLGLSLGCFLVSMIHQLTGGRWGYPTRRFLEAGFLVLPLMLVLFVPLLFGLGELYPWARPAEVAAQKVLRQRQLYDNTWAYIARGLFCFGVWIWMGLRLRRYSLQQDATSDATPTRNARRLSGPGLVIYGLLGTFALVDWVMGLESHWYSTLFAVIIIIGQILSTYAFAVVLLTLFSKQAPLAGVVNKTQYHQLANLLLAFVLFWSYVSFGQLLIVYSGDKPHEVDWYLHRIAGGWKWVVWALAVFHFFVPFYLLLFRSLKRQVLPLTLLAGMLFGVHLLENYWLVMPALHPNGLAVSWLDLSAPLGIGGLWVSVFLARLKAAPLLPQQDPALQFAFEYGH